MQALRSNMNNIRLMLFIDLTNSFACSRERDFYELAALNEYACVNDILSNKPPLDITIDLTSLHRPQALCLSLHHRYLILVIAEQLLTYSYLRAITGSSLAALFAGHIPKNKPTSAEKDIEPIIAINGISNGQLKREVNPINNKTPIKTPIIPPIPHNKIASTIN